MVVEIKDGYESDSYLITVSEPDSNKRLDCFLTDCLSSLTRNRIKKLIIDGHVLVQGNKSSPAKKIVYGEKISVFIPQTTDSDIIPQKINLDIVFEDNDIVVLNKPAGLVVHPGAGNYDSTLVNGLLYHCKHSLSGIGGIKRPGIVHRLDKGTSGLMVVAKNDESHLFLSQQFTAQTLKRSYLAICWGVPIPLQGTINGNIGRSARNRQKMAVLSSRGKQAITNYEVLEKLGSYCSVVRCDLKTGRTHQIRVHLTSIGHGLVADKTYGRNVRGLTKSVQDKVMFYKNQNRPLLHAEKLKLLHPKTGKQMKFKIDPPKDFMEIKNFLATI